MATWSGETRKDSAGLSGIAPVTRISLSTGSVNLKTPAMTSIDTDAEKLGSKEARKHTGRDAPRSPFNQLNKPINLL
jgi:hypothetical protein